MSNLKTPEDFITFLKEKKVYRQFKYAVKNNGCGEETDLDSLLKQCTEDGTTDEVFSKGFIWADTDPQEQGFSFWSEINAEWKNIY